MLTLVLLPEPKSRKAELLRDLQDIPGYEGFYKISIDGTIISIDRKVRRINCSGRITTYSVNRKVMRPTVGKNGYCVVNLSLNGNRTTTYVHRLIAEIFIPNPDSRPEVNHKNGIRSDNRVENLEWVTAQENQAHSFRELGRISGSFGKTGVLSKKNKPCIAIAPDGFEKRFEAVADACRELGLSFGTAGMVLRGHRKHTKGYKLIYV